MDLTNKAATATALSSAPADLHQGMLQRESLEKLMAETDPAVVRDCVRRQSHQCLLGDGEHIIAILTCCLANIRFNELRLKTKRYLMELMTQEDLNQMSDILLARAGTQLLDRIVDHRLRTIPGQRLVNMLARHGRLGFEEADMDVDGEDESDAPIVEAAASALCPMCQAACADWHGLFFHIQNNICQGPDRYNPERANLAYTRCWQSFSNMTSLECHIASKACQNALITGKVASASASASVPDASKSASSSGAVDTSTTTANPPHDLPRDTSAPATPVPTTPQLSFDDYDPNDPEKILTPDQRAAMNVEMAAARERYRARMATIADATDRDDAKKQVQLVRMRNSWNSTSSLIRKRYGIRLRGHRDKNFLDWEKQVMDMSSLAVYPSHPAYKKLKAELGGSPAATRNDNEEDGDDRPRKTPPLPPPLSPASANVSELRLQAPAVPPQTGTLSGVGSGVRSLAFDNSNKNDVSNAMPSPVGGSHHASAAANAYDIPEELRALLLDAPIPAPLATTRTMTTTTTTGDSDVKMYDGSAGDDDSDGEAEDIPGL